MGSFWTSRTKSAAGATGPAAALASLPPDVGALRYRGWRGGPMLSHRAFTRVHLTSFDVFAGLVLMVGGPVLWILSLQRVGALWARVFAFWSRHLHLGTAVVMVPQTWSRVPFALPSLNVSAGAPDPQLWWVTATGTALLLLVSLLISEEMMPWVYLLRAVAIVQTTALGYFAFAAARFPHDLASYTVSMEVFGVILIGLVPPIFGFTFYVFDFGLVKKAGLTLLAMAHLLLFIPHQYLLHAYLLRRSVLFMPVLYFALGPFLDVFVLICFYSWGMSWKTRETHL